MQREREGEEEGRRGGGRGDKVGRGRGKRRKGDEGAIRLRLRAVEPASTLEYSGVKKAAAVKADNLCSIPLDSHIKKEIKELDSCL